MDWSEVERPKPIATRAEFTSMLNELASDFHREPEKYEPTSIEDLLDRMAYYSNRPLQQVMANLSPDEDPDEPTWERFTAIIMGAMYLTD